MKKLVYWRQDNIIATYSYRYVITTLVKGVIMETNLSLSFELICLMEWLLKHEKNMLNGLIKQAIKGGLAADLKHPRTDDGVEVIEQLYRIMIDFLSYLERALADNLDRVESTEKGQKSVLNLLRYLDRECIDDRTVRTSVQEASKQLDELCASKDDSNDYMARRLFCKVLLKEWNPKSTEELH